MITERVETGRWSVRVKGSDSKAEFFKWCLGINMLDTVQLQVDDDDPVTALAGSWLFEYLGQKLAMDKLHMRLMDDDR